MSRLVNLVPTEATRRLAHRTILEAHKTTGPEAALNNLADLDPAQLTAFIGVLLTQIKATAKTGRPPLPLAFSERERRRGYAAYRRGDDSEWARAAYLEYQRVNQQARRKRQGVRRVPR